MPRAVQKNVSYIVSYRKGVIMNKKEIENWIKNTEKKGYIDCSEIFEIFEDGEYTFILNMAKELLKRLGE